MEAQENGFRRRDSSPPSVAKPLEGRLPLSSTEEEREDALGTACDQEVLQRRGLDFE